MSDQKVYIKVTDLLRFVIPISILLTFKITHTIGDYEYEQDFFKWFALAVTLAN